MSADCVRAPEFTRWLHCVCLAVMAFAFSGTASLAQNQWDVDAIESPAALLVGSIVDADTGLPIPARVHVRNATIPLDASSWVAVRCFESHPHGRIRFAHTNPVHVDIKDAPLRPRRVVVEHLIRRMRQELDRNQDVLSEQALGEYQRALQVYLELAKVAQ